MIFVSNCLIHPFHYNGGEYGRLNGQSISTTEKTVCSAFDGQTETMLLAFIQSKDTHTVDLVMTGCYALGQVWRSDNLLVSTAQTRDNVAYSDISGRHHHLLFNISSSTLLLLLLLMYWRSTLFNLTLSYSSWKRDLCAAPSSAVVLRHCKKLASSKWWRNIDGRSPWPSVTALMMSAWSNVSKLNT